MLVPIFMAKGDVRCCKAYIGVMLLVHVMNIFGRVLTRRIRKVKNADGMRFGFMPGRRMIDALFIIKRMQKEYRDKVICLYVFCKYREGFR